MSFTFYLVRVKDNNLLSILLEEFPQVQLSPHTVSHMWKQQLRQIDQLSPSQNQNRQTQSKLLKQVRDLTHTHTETHYFYGPYASKFKFVLIKAFALSAYCQHDS